MKKKATVIALLLLTTLGSTAASCAGTAAETGERCAATHCYSVPFG